MPEVLPRAKDEYLSFCRVHGPLWEEHAGVLGLDAEFLNRWREAEEAAAADHLAALAAQNAALAATARSNRSLRASRQLSAEAVRLIGIAARRSGEEGRIYALAGLPAPGAGGWSHRLPPPGAPTDLSASLQSDGSITLRWRTNNPPGVGSVAYVVRRRAGVQGEFEHAGVAGAGGSGFGEFRDAACPTPSGELPVVQYTVQAFRGETAGPASAVLSVFFGTGSGAAQTSPASPVAMTLAA